MCLLHDSEEYGVLRWPLKEIAAAASCKLSDLKGLINKGVLKGGDDFLRQPFIYTPRSGRQDGTPVVLIGEQAGPLWYSSRMVRDEYVRTIRGDSSRFSGTPKPSPTESPKPPFGDGSSPSASSAASQGEADRPPTRPKKVTFSTWLETIKASGERAITDHRPLWDYANRVGLPDEMVGLAWRLFRRRYLADPEYQRKLYADWRQVFRNAVEGNWFKLWTASDDGYRLTTQGVQAQRELDAEEQAA